MMNHKYIATDTVRNITIEGEKLSDVTKEVRKHIKLKHGNKIRTDLIEDGMSIAGGFGNKKNIRDVYYCFRIEVMRWGVQNE